MASFGLVSIVSIPFRELKFISGKVSGHWNPCGCAFAPKNLLFEVSVSASVVI